MDKLRLATFEPLVGEVFSVPIQNEETLNFELLEVNRLKGPNDQYECFSLSFRSDSKQTIEQFSFPLNHPEFGEFHLFLVPYQSDDSGTYYEAVVNRKLADLEEKT